MDACLAGPASYYESQGCTRAGSEFETLTTTSAQASVFYTLEPCFFPEFCFFFLLAITHFLFMLHVFNEH